ncbi:GNAT family N-acetyltransferase [Clostridiaceae bacterium M8S5]|nr:GNAT family N-acetyltransferase [Clostridiaceae bacterium M8S5]
MKIKERMESNRLVIKKSSTIECERLQNICMSWDDKIKLEGEEFEDDYIEKCLKNGDLPPIQTASKDNYRLKSIYLKKGNELIGFFDLYYGYPAEDTIWIGMFLIDKKYQNNGYAREVIELVIKESNKTDYRKIGIGVYLKNWKGLRFWTRAGFDKVFTISGDKEYSDKTFALIGLEKYLD